MHASDFKNRIRSPYEAEEADSIVAYEAWRASGDNAVLEEIRSYNEFDCTSTKLCRDWLLTQRPAEAQWRPPGEAEPPSAETLEARSDAEARTAKLSEALLSTASDEDRPLHQLAAAMLDFHRREAKPQYWAMFHRQDMTHEELLEDAESIALIAPSPDDRPWQEKKSTVQRRISSQT